MMKKQAAVLPILLSIMMFFLTSSFGVDTVCASLGQGQAANQILYVPGELLVKFKEGVSQDVARVSLATMGARVVKNIGSSGVSRIKLPAALSVEEAITRYSMDSNVEYAEPNYIRFIAVIPSDADFSELWGLDNTGQLVNGVTGTPDADIDAPEAWDITTGSDSVVIAVIDTGVTYNHPEMISNMWVNSLEQSGVLGVDDDGNGYIDDTYGWDFVDNDEDPEDYNSHGSHVAGTIAARGDNVTAITGVNWIAKIMAIRAASVTGFLAVDKIAEAIYYAVDNGAKIINASFGGSGFSQTSFDALSYAENHGVLFVAAAGNETADNDSNPHYPSSYSLSNIIAIAATDQNDSLASFSNYGATSVDVAAPGTNIYSTIPVFSYGSKVTIYSESFEPLPDPADWIEGGTNATWDFGVGTGVGGTDCLEDSPGANYSDNTDSVMVYANPFSSVKNNRYTLSFKVEYELEDSADFFYSSASGEGILWFLFNRKTGSSAGAFIDESVDLTFFADLFSSFYVGFWLESDSSVNNDGVYLDDLELYREPISVGGYDYDHNDGTSMATPQVVGVAGLITAQNPNYSHLQIRDAILDTVDSIPSLSGKILTGGRVNAFKAVTYLAPPTGVGANPAEGSIRLSWNSNSESALNGYIISYGTTASFGTEIDVGNVTSYLLGGLANGTRYYLAVKAYGDFPAAGTIEGNNSATATATPSIAEAVVDAVAKSAGDGGGCFIATAAYGSRMAQQVKTLADFRDKFLLTNSTGRILVRSYYKVSPPLADFIARHDTLRAVTRWSLLPLVGVSWLALKLGPMPSLAFMLMLLTLMAAATVSFCRRVRAAKA
jgi:subtilisin family serine protease